MKKVDVAIVGAGPAGTTCAYELLKNGHECLLIDCATFPRDKICGGGLTPKAYRLLAEIFPHLTYDYVPVHRMHLYVGKEYIGAYDLEAEIRVVQRKVFDHLLLQQYLQEKGNFVQDTLVKIEETDHAILLTLHSGEQVKCRILVGADGANSRVRKYLNPNYCNDALFLEKYTERSGSDEISIELSNDCHSGYYYNFPNKAHDVIGHGERHTDFNRVHQHLNDWHAEKEKLRGAYIPYKQNYPTNDRILLIGDAGCWADALTYEGLYYALVTGYNASKAILDGRPFKEVNAAIATKKKHKEWESMILYNRLGLCLLRIIGRHKRFTEMILNRYMR